MLLVIGPTSAGKSTYIDTLRTEAEGRGETLQVHLAHQVATASDVPAGPGHVLHYNLLRGYKKGTRRVAADKVAVLPELIAAADEVVVLVAPRTVIQARVAARGAERDAYDHESWGDVVASPELGQIYEHLALCLDGAGTPYRILCTHGEHHEAYHPLSRWEFPRMAEPDAEDLCRRGHVLTMPDLGAHTYQADYREGAEGSGRSATFARAFQMPLHGRRLLDIGCAEGAASLSAARMGAVVTGIEPRKTRRTKAQRIAEATGVTLDLRPGLLDDLEEPDGSFDVVVALNVIHHVPDPFAFLDRMAALSSSHVVLEYPGLDDAKFRSTISEFPSPPPELPLMGLSLPERDQTYVFSPAVFERYLIDTMGLFRKHEFVESPIPNRWISVFSGRVRKAQVGKSVELQTKAKGRGRRPAPGPEAEIARLRQRIAAMEDSRSWKVTRPLRSLASRVR